MRLKSTVLSITNLGNTTDLTAIGIKILNVSNLVRKLTITQKLVKLRIKSLLIIIMINILISGNFTATLKHANLASKNNMANFVKNTVFGNKIKYVTLNKNELN